VVSTTAGEPDTPGLEVTEPDRQVRLGVVTGQVHVGHHGQLPRTDELQPQVGDAHDLGQVQQSLQGGLSHFAVDLLTEKGTAGSG
jgi:hypothetical protein